jgi:hypothetical protein
VRPTTVYSAREGERFSADTTLTVVSCSTCHMTYAIPESLYKSAVKWHGDRTDGRGWKLCCPLGHTWWYIGESEGDRAKRLLKSERDYAARLAAERDQAKASLHGQKIRASRFKNDRDRERKRAAAGVCPCCNRSFQNLARHMTGQHPGFGNPKPE